MEGGDDVEPEVDLDVGEEEEEEEEEEVELSLEASRRMGKMGGAKSTPYDDSSSELTSLLSR